VPAEATLHGHFLSLRAPMNGSVLNVQMGLGTVLDNPASSVMTIASLEEVWVTASLRKKDMTLFAANQPVEVAFIAYPDEVFIGDAHLVDDTPDDAGHFKVKIELQNPARRLKPNMYALATFRGPTETAPIIPATALIRRNDRDLVFVEVERWTFEARPVEIGFTRDGQTIAMSGANIGEHIVVMARALRDDSRFRIRSLRGDSNGRDDPARKIPAPNNRAQFVTLFSRTKKIFKSFGRLKSIYCTGPCIVAAMISSAVAPALASEQSQNWTWCMNARHVFPLDFMIRGCTAVIQSGEDPAQDQAVAFAYRGNAYREKGDLDWSLSDFNEAIRINPGFALAMTNRGNVYRAKGDFESALADYNEAIRLAPGISKAFANRGSLYHAMGEFYIVDLGEAIRIDPNDPFAWFNRGATYGAIGDFRRALIDYDEAIRLYPTFSTAFNNRGTIFRDMGDLDRALSDFTDAIRRDPWFAMAYHNRAQVWALKGELGRAIADFTTALILDPNDASAFRGRGLARQKMGDDSGAEVDFEEANTINQKPTEEFAKRDFR
jgi:tetratricopeptide (TPR) repeat protein